MHYYKLFKVVYEKISYKNIVFVVKTYKLTQNFIYLHKLKNKMNPNRPLVEKVILF
jgi:hypothetical protein